MLNFPADCLNEVLAWSPDLSRGTCLLGPAPDCYHFDPPSLPKRWSWRYSEKEISSSIPSIGPNVRPFSLHYLSQLHIVANLGLPASSGCHKDGCVREGSVPTAEWLWHL